MCSLRNFHFQVPEAIALVAWTQEHSAEKILPAETLSFYQPLRDCQL